MSGTHYSWVGWCVLVTFDGNSLHITNDGKNTLVTSNNRTGGIQTTFNYLPLGCESSVLATAPP